MFCGIFDRELCALGKERGNIASSSVSLSFSLLDQLPVIMYSAGETMGLFWISRSQEISWNESSSFSETWKERTRHDDFTVFFDKSYYSISTITHAQIRQFYNNKKKSWFIAWIWVWVVQFNWSNWSSLTLNICCLICTKST